MKSGPKEYVNQVASIYQDFPDIPIGDANYNHHLIILLRIESYEVGIGECYWWDLFPRAHYRNMVHAFDGT